MIDCGPFRSRVALAALCWACRACAARGGGHGAVPAERSGVLVARRRRVGAQRQLPVGQPAVERAAVSARHSRADAGREDRPRLSRRRTGTELHLHRLAQAVDRLHRRHPPRQSGSASALQGAVRIVGDSRRLRRAAVLEAAAAGPDRAIEPRKRSSTRTRPRAASDRLYTETMAQSARSTVHHASIRSVGGRSARHRVRVSRVLHVRSRASSTRRRA